MWRQHSLIAVCVIRVHGLQDAMHLQYVDCHSICTCRFLGSHRRDARCHANRFYVKSSKPSLHSKYGLLQVSARLYQFDQLGPDIVELATKYRDLQEDLDHATFTLREFQKAAAD